MADDGDDGPQYEHVHYLPPEASTSSSGDGVCRSDYLVVETCDVACGVSDLESSGDSSDALSCGSRGLFPDPSRFGHISSFHRRVQLRDAHRGWLPCWAYVGRSGGYNDSVDPRPPSVCRSLCDDSPSGDDIDALIAKYRRDSFDRGHFDGELLRWYHPHFNRHGIPVRAKASVSNKWPGAKFRSWRQRSIVWDIASRGAPLRNIRVGTPAIRNRYQIGQVVRHQIEIYIRNLEGRRTGVETAVMRVIGGHHVSNNCQFLGVAPQLPSHVRIVYMDVRKVHWCSVGSIISHSFAWPTFDAKKVKSIARTLWTNHCHWVDVLVIHGRCWCSNNCCLRSNRVFENLLWHWNDERRPWVVYKEGSASTGGGEPIPAWLDDGYCVCDDFCQCNLVGMYTDYTPRVVNGQDWHHLGTMYSNCDVVC